jgi:hypothetical protein
MLGRPLERLFKQVQRKDCMGWRIVYMVSTASAHESARNQHLGPELSKNGLVLVLAVFGFCPPRSYASVPRHNAAYVWNLAGMPVHYDERLSHEHTGTAIMKK